MQPLRVSRSATLPILAATNKNVKARPDSLRDGLQYTASRGTLSQNQDQSSLMYPASARTVTTPGAAPATAHGSAARLARRLAVLARQGRALALRGAPAAAAEAPSESQPGPAEAIQPTVTPAGPASRAQPRAQRRPASAAPRRAGGGKPGRPGRPGRTFPDPVPSAAPPRGLDAAGLPPVPAPQDAGRPALFDPYAARPATPRAATC